MAMAALKLPDHVTPATHVRPARLVAAQPPLTASGLVVRERLSKRLDEALARPLTLVVAGGGFGKTTALEQWAARSTASIAWVTLEESDDEPLSFLRRVLGAVGRDEAQPTIASVARALEARVCATRPFALVLDDIDHLQSDAVVRTVGALFELLTANVRVVIAARSEPALPLARLRGRGLVAQVGERELRFEAHEAEQLVVAQLACSTHVARLMTLTSGWALGLAMAVNALRAGASLAQLEAPGALLVEELIDALPSDARADLFSLCATPDAVSPTRLATLEALGLVVRTPRGVRLHRLISDYCRARIERDRPSLMPFFIQPVVDVVAERPMPAEDPSADGLTARELDVLRLLVAGFSRREMATRLNISEETIKTHARRLFRKLQVSDRAQAVIAARARGLAAEVSSGA
jgi:LuxR family maltose regulon positive regulatory protein